MSRRICLSCRFFESRYSEDNTLGYCRRYPPRGFGRMIADWAFPMVRRNDWCGEWSAIESQEASQADGSPTSVGPGKTANP